MEATVIVIILLFCAAIMISICGYVYNIYSLAESIFTEKFRLLFVLQLIGICIPVIGIIVGLVLFVVDRKK